MNIFKNKIRKFHKLAVFILLRICYIHVFKYFRNNLIRKTGVILTFVFLITLVPLTQINAQESYLPQWLKTNAEWWAKGEISDEAYAKDIQWLLSNQLISEIPYNMQTDSTYVLSSDVPELQQIIRDLESRIKYLEEQLMFASEQGIPGSQGPVGPQGKEGKQGIPGPMGPPGQGLPAVPLLLSLGDRGTSLTTEMYVGQGVGTLDYSGARILSPLDGKIKNLYVLTTLSVNVPIDVILVKNGIETELKCTLDSTRTCANLSSTVEINALDTFAIKLVKKAPSPIDKFGLQASMVLLPPE